MAEIGPRVTSHESRVTTSQWIAPAWFGEFGWEVMSFAPWCRARARELGPAWIASFAESRALYADFAIRFRAHGAAGRSLNYPKGYGMYRSDQPGFEHIRFGVAGRAQAFDCLIHARGIARKAAINYRHWLTLILGLRVAGRKVGVIGTPEDLWDPAWAYGALPTAPPRDLRGLPLMELMDTVAASRVVVGCSSGVMHLAAACGCDLVVWGDTKTRYGETLERRYKERWNPQHVAVQWLDADDWNPEPQRILAAIERI